TLDIRLVDAIEALAKALTDSLTQPGFLESNASCFPLQPWSSGAQVLSNVMSLSSFNSGRGEISYNSTTGFFNAHGVEIVASFTEQAGAAARFELSGRFSSGSLTKLFHKTGAAFVFPNTFTGFNDASIVACAPPVLKTELGNRSFIGTGYVPDIVEYLSKKLNFRYVLKKPDDGQWGGPVPGSPYFSGCVGEVQRGIVHLGAGTFTKTTLRDSVIDFSADLFAEYNGILVPKPKPSTKMWNVFYPLSWQLWLCLAASLFVAAFCVWIMAYYSPFSAVNLQLECAITDEVNYLEYLWTVTGCLMQQGQDFYPFA
uniref:Lig_chan-Glu_bd domain-containing protein n=1 Tax=Macrostomum lignano TaxID=282301 RepID=A0A1I8GT76_9PLAT